MTEVLRAQPKIDVVYGHNDPMAIGAYLAAKELGREKEMIFVGVDGLGGEAGGIKKVMDGVLAATFVYPLCVDKAVEIGAQDAARPVLQAGEGLQPAVGHGDPGERRADVPAVHGAGTTLKFTRRTLTRTLAGSLAASLAPAARPQTPGRRKNMLLLMSDQHRPHALGIDGNPVARTPNLDALAARRALRQRLLLEPGLRAFPRVPAHRPLHAQSRRATTTASPWPFEHKTMAHHFGRAGYMTGLIGKMHFVDAQTHGFDYRLDFNDWCQYLGPKTKLYADELCRANSGSGMPQIDDLWRDAGDPWKGAREQDDRRASSRRPRFEDRRSRIISKASSPANRSAF